MAIQKRFIHFKKFSDFNSKKLSANEANTQYTIGVSGAIQSGAPDILYQSYCWIKDTQQQWTHGQLYNGKEASGGEENVQSDWNVTDTSSDAYIKNKPTIPSAVTESTVSGWGFTKNTGTYSKPSGGIPKTDLASAVQTSLGKADTALQSYTEQYKGTVTGVKINGSTKNPSSGVVDLGTVITSHQDISGKQDKLVSGTNIKSINGESILGAGDIKLEKYATDKSWSIVASNLLELSMEYDNAPDGTKAIIVTTANNLYGVNLFDALMGNVDGVIDVFTNLDAFTLEISAIDTSVELPVSITSDVRVEIPFNNKIYIDMGADMASIYHIYVQAGFTESAWGEGHWYDTSYMIGNKIPLSRFETLDDNAYAGLMAIAPALIVDFVGTKTITEYIKNGDNWEVWSEVESGLNTKLNAWLEQIAQLLPTKTSQLENDSNFVSSDNLKTINGQSILGSGNIEISGGGGGGDSSVFITHFTIYEFVSGDVEFTDEQLEDIIDAARQNKIIALPYFVGDGRYGFVVSSYNYDEDFSSGELYWHLSLRITHDNITYINDIDIYSPYFNYASLTINPNKALVESVSVDEDGFALADSYNKDNLIIVVGGECTCLHIGEVGSEYGMTVRFFTGADCAIEYWGNWANGVIPTIEPYTAYEMSIVHGADYMPCAVLTPFKLVE